MLRQDDATLGGVFQKVDALRNRHMARDIRAAEVRAVRHGDFDQVAPDLFSEDWPRPIVANRIDVIARHAAAALSPLPTFSCQSLSSSSDRAREIADKRTKIVNAYVRRSRLASQMQSGADQFYSYGLIVGSVEPDKDGPAIFIEDAAGFYPVWDRAGRTIAMARVFKREVHELMAEYPDIAPQIKAAVETRNGPDQRAPITGQVEVTKYVDAKRIVMYLSSPGRVVLINQPNPIGRCTYVAKMKPGLDNEIRGTFDDLIWVQLALHQMQTLTLSAADQAVNAPIAAPNDVTNITFGPGEVIRSNNPEQIRRVAVDVPASAWTASQYMGQELQYGAITPEALGGSIDASVVTGKGVQQLMAGYSQQIAMAQETLVGFFQDLLELCLRFDEKVWPDVTKSATGVADGAPYRLSYKPSRDIDGDYSVSVAYGGVAGLDPNRALIYLLQAQGAGLLSKDLVRRNMPGDFNPADEEAKIVLESLRQSLIESMSALAQSIPAMVAQGQDPSEILQRISKATKLTQKGSPIEDILAQLFPPPEPAPQGGSPAPGSPEEAAAQAGAGAGFGPEGLPSGLEPGMATRGPGARPDIQTLFAGLSPSGAPNMSGGVSRMIPV